ncbi:lytic polysaccharide monooxygenase [Kitasatospora sp. NPDC050543]|uniref:lytic polysaccharide monooxygenase auxiliary activity family 9 protein n=1 Tax=Kitasatospora sp. NPDC050543 TaxID=3364054 RepID=UPI0037A685B7
MSTRRPTAALLTLAGCALAATLGSGTASAHGSMQNPLSRVEGCYLEGAEHPESAACKAAVALGGTAALYDWMSLRIGDAAGRHRELIPDGRLCSAGSQTYRGLDLPRADWPATNLTSGADFTFRFRATAPHRGTFQLFMTNSSYDPAKPLTWSNLEAQPFVSVTDPQLADGSYVLPGKIPAGRTGRQLIYAIWQRSDSPEAFYSCSDVVFDGSGSTAGTAPVPTADGTSPAGGHSHPASPAAPTATTGPAATSPAVTSRAATSPSSGAPATGAGSAPAPAPPAAPAAVAAALASTPPAAPTAAVPSAPAAPPAASGTAAAESLAQTGASDRSTALLSAVGVAFLLAGTTVAVLRRRRRTPGAHAR